jgi:lantibiotic modifying enzyme
MIATQTNSVSEKALYLARELGERLLIEVAAPDRLDVNAEHYATRRMNGTVGFALCFLGLARATGDARYEAAMHCQLARAARADGNEVGLFSGYAGLAAVAHLACAVEPRYERLVTQCLQALDSSDGCAERDLLFGSAGIAVARSLVANNIEHEWEWTDARDALAPPRAHECLGLAHGTPGAIVAVAMTPDAISNSVEHDLRAAMRRIANMSRAKKSARVWARYDDDPREEACRSVWCFGTPGVAIALLQAALRIGDVEMEAFARDSLLSIEALPREELLVAHLGLCHGAMGNALVYFAALHRTGDQRFGTICERYVAETIAMLNSVGPRTVTPGRDGVPYDAIGHLNGIAGIALGLLTTGGYMPADWLTLHGMFV